MTADIDLLVCENLEREVRAIVSAEQWEDIVVTVSPALCPGTQVKSDRVRRFISDNTDPSRDRIVIGCGGLREHAGEPADPETAVRRSMASCYELLLQADMAASLVAEHAFLITPGWLQHWPQYVDEWGFDRQTMRAFMADSASHLVLLDTKAWPDTHKHLQEFAEFVDRPTRIITVGLDHVRLHVTNMVLEHRLRREQATTERALADAQRRLADYGMSFDLLSGLTGLESEEDVIDAVLWLFTILFTPKSLTYYPLGGAEEGAVPIHYPDVAFSSVSVAKTASAEDGSDGNGDGSDTVGPAGHGVDRLARIPTLPDLSEPYEWISPEREGFFVRIGLKEAPVGAVRVEGSAFPQYMQEYINLALSLSDVCALAIADARRHGYLRSTIAQLEDALANIKTLSGLIPICAGCKKIRDDEGFWTQVESYVAERTSAEFTHGMCPDCLERYGLMTEE